MSRQRIALAAALLGVLGLGGAAIWGLRPPPPPPTGFVAIRTTFSLPTADAFLLGTAPIDTLNRGVPAETTVTEAVGPTKLRLRRGGLTFDVCDITVRPNRITTVAVVNVDNTMRCRVDA